MIKFLSLFLSICMAAVSLNAKTLVVYYSYTNNVEKVIDNLSNQIECDIVEIEPVEKGLDYAANNYAIGSALISAIRSNPDRASSYPEIDPVDVNLDEYDVIIIGAPLWWSQMAAPLQTFLFNNGKKMAGKKIGLIVSSHSSGISGVVADAKRLIPDGEFLEPALWMRSSEIGNCESKIAQWLKDINYNDISTSIATPTSYGDISYTLDSGYLHVTGSHNLLSLFDKSGVKVGETKNSTINISPLPKGLYFLLVNTETGNKSYKIIKF